MEDSLALSVLSVMGAVFLSFWVMNGTLGVAQGLSARPPPLRKAFFTCVSTAVIPSTVAYLTFGTLAATVPALIGAGCFLVSMFVHHKSLGICVWGAGVCVVVAVSGAPQSLLLYLALSFCAAFLFSQEAVCAVFGPGAVLFSVAAATVMGTLYLLGPLPLSVAAVMGSATLFYLLLTGQPARPDRFLPIVVTATSIIGTAAIALETAHTAVPAALPMAGLAVVLSAFIAYYCRQPGVLGPFYNFERRSSVLSTACMVAALASVSSFEDGFEPVLSNSLLQFVAGYAMATVSATLLATLSNIWEPVSSTSHRFLWVDSLSVIAYVIAPAAFVLALAPGTHNTVSHMQHAYLTLSQRALGNGWLSQLFLTPSSSWHVGAVSAVLATMCHVLQWHFVSTTLGLAPLLAHVVGKASSRSSNVALTFNGGPNLKTTPGLLRFLSDHGVVATFFVDTEGATEEPELLHQMSSQGHEIGCLGHSGSTKAALLDIVKCRQAIYAATGKVPEWYRPADGSRDLRVLRRANRAGLRIALWSVSTWDWDLGRVATHLPRWLQNQRIAAGDVIHMHHTIPGYLAPSLAKVLPTHSARTVTASVVAHLEAIGLQFATLSTLHPVAEETLEA